MNNIFLRVVALLLYVTVNMQSEAQSTSQMAIPDSDRLAPLKLPGKGLIQHDFFYAGENGNNLVMYIVKGGKITWSYT
ncbi:MAG TPA: hypothetical protein VF623_02170, partial [Segetibacter sp.]